MTAEEIRRRLGILSFEPRFTVGWSASDRTFPSESCLPFLEGSFILQNAALAGLPDEAVATLEAVARHVAGNPPLCRLLWHEHRLYTGAVTPERTVSTRRRHLRRKTEEIPFLDQEFDPSGFPDLTPILGDDTSLVNLLIALSAVPDTLSFYEQRRLPRDVLRDSLSELGLWYRYYRRRFGSGGIHAGTLSWLRFTLRGQLVRLGRLQFMQGEFSRDLTVYRSRRSGTVRALAASGLVVGVDGLLRIDTEEKGPARTTHRWTSGGVVHGNPILPSGRVAKEEIELALDEFLPVLQERTPVLEVHIPEDGPMREEEWADSLLRASEFFPAYFPERGFRAFTCESWFLGRELLDLLPADSNMARFAEAFFLYPSVGGEEEALGRVFGPFYHRSGPEEWPRETRLQRAVADHLSAGGTLREGGGFILAEDLPRLLRRAGRRREE